MHVLAALVGFPAMMHVAACSGPPRAAFGVVVSHGPVETTTDLTLAQIAEMARRAAQAGKHPPFGFYTGGFGSAVGVEVGPRSEADCAEPVRVTVTLGLAERRIEIGKEIAARPCLFSVVLDHYRRHAAADDALPTDFARALGAALPQTPLPPLQHDPGRADEDAQRIQRAVASVVERGLASLDAARADARDRVDTPEEVRKLAHACGAPG